MSFSLREKEYERLSLISPENDNDEDKLVEAITTDVKSTEVRAVKETAQRKPKRRDIQGLRGVAIIYVLIFHLKPELLPSGFLGVDIFFIISGYLITMILWRKNPLTLEDVENFFSKRIRRIFPVHFTMVILVLIFGFFCLAADDYRLLKIDSLWAITFTFNIHKYLQNMDYFAEIANYGFMLHTWSLAVEIQYYLFAPFIVFCLRQRIIGKFLWFSLIVSSVWFNYTASGPLQFSSLPSRIWQFLLGGTAYLLPLDVGKNLTNIIALLGISPVVLFLPIDKKLSRYIVSFASALVISARNDITDKYVLGNPVLYFVGDISYSLYLAHWPIIIFFKYYTNTEELIWKDCLLALEITIILSIASFYTIEKYFITNNLLHTFIYLAALSGFFILLIFNTSQTSTILSPIINVTTEVPTAVKPKTRFESACFDFPDVPYLPAINITDSIRQEAIKNNLLFTKEPFFFFSQDYKSKDDYYIKHFIKTKTKNNYYDYYKGNGTVNVLVFGNSYAHRAFRYVVSAFGERILEARLIAISACQPFKVNVQSYCQKFVEQTVNLAEDLKPDVIFVIYRPHGKSVTELNNLLTDTIMKGMQETVNRLSKAAKLIVLQFPLPNDYEKAETLNVLKCLQKNLPFDDLNIKFSIYWKQFASVTKRLENLVCNNCVKIYPHRIFCDSTICRVFDPDNLFSFFDGNTHYNAYAMKCIGKLYSRTINYLFAEGYFV